MVIVLSLQALAPIPKKSLRVKLQIRQGVFNIIGCSTHSWFWIYLLMHVRGRADTFYNCRIQQIARLPEGPDATCETEICTNNEATRLQICSLTKLLTFSCYDLVIRWSHILENVDAESKMYSTFERFMDLHSVLLIRSSCQYAHKQSIGKSRFFFSFHFIIASN